MSILCVDVIIVAKCIGRAAANGLEDQVRVGPPPGITCGESDYMYTLIINMTDCLTHLYSVI